MYSAVRRATIVSSALPILSALFYLVRSTLRSLRNVFGQALLRVEDTAERVESPNY